MKIVIRHGKARAFSGLANKCVGEFLSEEGIQSVLSAKKEILPKFTVPPPIFTSDLDRGVETGILLAQDDEAILTTTRQYIADQIVAQEIRSKGGIFYCKHTIVDLPPRITVNQNLEYNLPPEIAALDDFVAVLHWDAVQSLGLELRYGEFAEIS